MKINSYIFIVEGGFKGHYIMMGFGTSIEHARQRLQAEYGIGKNARVWKNRPCTKEEWNWTYEKPVEWFMDNG